nr:MAG TPA: hypothetical protein [Caudoviricetes sp.]DAV40959.1 MAG TPA: hypothetical protein [Caudoviricetes sp.]
MAGGIGVSKSDFIILIIICIVASWAWSTK